METYSGALPVGSPPVTWEKFSSAFHDHLIAWSVKEESRLRFENLRQDNLFVIEYEACFCQLSKHALAIIPDEKEDPRFVRGMTLYQISCVSSISKGGFFSVHCERRQKGGIDGERGV